MSKPVETDKVPMNPPQTTVTATSAASAGATLAKLMEGNDYSVAQTNNTATITLGLAFVGTLIEAIDFATTDLKFQLVAKRSDRQLSMNPRSVDQLIEKIEAKLAEFDLARAELVALQPEAEA